MSTIPFDTLAFTKKMTKAGMPQEQAEVLAESQAELIEQRLATKADLTVALKELEYRLTLRLGSMMVVAIGIVATLVKLL